MIKPCSGRFSISTGDRWISSINKMDSSVGHVSRIPLASEVQKVGMTGMNYGGPKSLFEAENWENVWKCTRYTIIYIYQNITTYLLYDVEMDTCKYIIIYLHIIRKKNCQESDHSRVPFHSLFNEAITTCSNSIRRAWALDLRIEKHR